MVILGVCYDTSTLMARHAVLEGTGWIGVPASSYGAAWTAIQNLSADVMVICAGVPTADKFGLSQEFKRKIGGAVVWVMNEAPDASAWSADSILSANSSAEDIRRAILSASASIKPRINAD